jgi:hypothetical protein
MIWENDDGRKGGIVMQITDVTKPLASVGKVANAGNRIVFEPDGGYIEHIKSGNRTRLKKQGTVYTLDVWVKARNSEDELLDLEEGSPQKESPFSRQVIP